VDIVIVTSGLASLRSHSQDGTLRLMPVSLPKTDIFLKPLR